MITIGEQIATLPFKATGGCQGTLDDYRGRWLVLYFYPKDATPGCTTEGCQFRDQLADFSALDATVFGVSRDSLASHEKFKAKKQFNFELISDADSTLCNYFDVIKTKSLFGLSIQGIQRSTFIIDDKGILRQAWRKVRVKDHVQQVMDALQQLKK